jgi:hypothetical protein
VTPVWVMLLLFIVAPAPGPNPQAVPRSYPTKQACIDDIPNAVRKDAAKPGTYAAVCVEGVVPF